MSCCLIMVACKPQVQPADEGLIYPLAFGSDTTGIRQDKLTRAYISPQKVVWTKGNLQHTENLLDASTDLARELISEHGGEAKKS